MHKKATQVTPEGKEIPVPTRRDFLTNLGKVVPKEGSLPEKVSDDEHEGVTESPPEAEQG